MKTRNITNAIALVFCALVVAASLANVLPDNTEVLAMAQRAACDGKDKCSLYKVSVLRLPIWQTVTFTDGKQTLDVRCRRAAIVFGYYDCQPVR